MGENYSGVFFSVFHTVLVLLYRTTVLLYTAAVPLLFSATLLLYSTVQYCQYCTVLYYSELKILATVHIIGTVLNCNELPSSWWRTTHFVTAYPVRNRKSVYDVPP